MADRTTTSSERAISFGPFRLLPAQQLLLEDEVPVRLGSRAFDILTALVEKPGELVSKTDLITHVWPETFIDENTLRVNIAGLRKALGDGQPGRRYIANVPGRGYRFVAAIKLLELKEQPPHEGGRQDQTHNLPPQARAVGRAEVIEVLAGQLRERRFVSIVGAGGVGKTTVAVAVAHELLDAFANSVLFIDLGVLNDPEMVPALLTSMLGLAGRAGDPTTLIISFLRDKRILVILDNCEHVIDAAANLANLIFTAASEVHILATSREALRVDGERVHRLASLTLPPDDADCSTAVALEYSAVALFVQRAQASGAQFDLTGANVAIIADICRKLDGMPLAIEMAAGRVEAYGLAQTAALLERHMSVLWPGRRTAPPRQQTLRATLDWSYELLSEPERAVLCRLAVFVGAFTIEAALAVVTSATIDQSQVFEALDSLIAKSLVASRPAGAMMRYRLLETMRAYALEKLNDDGAARADVGVRHARYYLEWLERARAEWPTMSSAEDRAPYLAGLANVRTALGWCFSEVGNTGIGIGLAAAAVPFLLATSQLVECQRWCERGLEALDETTRGGHDEMRLQATFGTLMMFRHGVSQTVRATIDRSLAIAEARGEAEQQLLLLGPLHSFHLRIGHFKAALGYAERACAVAAAIEDPAASALANTFLGISRHHNGDLAGSDAALTTALRYRPSAPRTGTIYLGPDNRLWASVTLARNLWLRGFPDQAIQYTRRIVGEAVATDLPVPLTSVLGLAIPVFFWVGDLRGAEALIDQFVSVTEAHSLGSYIAIARGFRGELAIRQGDFETGIKDLMSCLQDLRKAPFDVPTASFDIPLVQGLAAVGRTAEGIALIAETIRLGEMNGDNCPMAELLRVKGTLLLSTAAADAEACYHQALEVSCRQGALSWELRAATSLANLWRGQGRTEEAQNLLAPIYRQFTQGFATADLIAAGRLMTERRMTAAIVE